MHGGGTFMHFSPILSGRSKQIRCHFKADTYDIEHMRQSPSRVYSLKAGTNNRTFSKISINLVIVGFHTTVTDIQIVVQAV